MRGAGSVLYGWSGSLRGSSSAVAHYMLFIVPPPLIGFLLAYVLMTLVYFLFRKSTPARWIYFRKLQLVSAALFSSPMARTTRRDHGIITGVLFASNTSTPFACRSG